MKFPRNKRIEPPTTNSSKQEIWEWYLCLSEKQRKDFDKLLLNSPEERQPDEHCDLFLVRSHITRILKPILTKIKNHEKD